MAKITVSFHKHHNKTTGYTFWAVVVYDGTGGTGCYSFVLAGDHALNGFKRMLDGMHPGWSDVSTVAVTQ